MKVKRVIVSQGGTTLRIQFDDTSELIVPSPRKLRLTDTVECRGTELYVRGEFLLDAMYYANIAWGC